jgi:hypothetical protein
MDLIYNIDEQVMMMDFTDFVSYCKTLKSILNQIKHIEINFVRNMLTPRYINKWDIIYVQSNVDISA